MNNFVVLKTTKLRFVGPGSDKVYNVLFVRENEIIYPNYAVYAEYGKFGGRLATIQKNEGLGYYAAHQVYRSLIAEKKAKGYKSARACATVRPLKMLAAQKYHLHCARCAQCLAADASCDLCKIGRRLLKAADRY